MTTTKEEEIEMRYYKVLNDGKSCISGNFDWTPYLPKDGQPGDWTPRITGDLVMCSKGYHLTGADHLLDWCKGNQLFEAEAKGLILVGDDTVACKQVRLIRQVEGWNDKRLRLFACWCVREYCWDKLTDERSRNAVIVAEKYANGEATVDELTAAWDVAWDVAWDAAWDVAWDAARAAARDVAWAAARDAARAAARDVAWAAARDAAWDVAWDVAWDAAWDVAWDAMNKKLCEMVGVAQ